MSYILKYRIFNESKGISDSSEILTNDIWLNIQSDIISYISNSNKFDFDESDFKLKDLVIEYNLINDVDNSCNAITNLKNSKIKDKYLTDIKVILNIRYSLLDEQFLFYIKSVLFHEILHIFQHYNFKINNKFRSKSFSIGSVLPQLRPYIKTNYINYILDVLYFSLSHELSAQLHQYYIYKKVGKDYEKINDIKKLLSGFHIKKLDEKENIEIDIIKEYIIKSIKYYSNNKKYIKNTNNSIWFEIDNDKFLSELSLVFKTKLKWLNKKIKMINSKVDINLDETFTYYGFLEDYRYIDVFNFISEKLNDCKSIYYI